MTRNGAVFLDRDGVVNELVVDGVSGLPESPIRAADVHVSPRAALAVRTLARLGVPLVVVSNPPAAAKGTATCAQLFDVHHEIERQLANLGAHIDMYRYCFHHPGGTDARLGVTCACRKPAPGMLLEAARELDLLDLSTSWLIGDSDVDVLAGRAAGCRTVLVEEPASQHRRGSVEPDVRAADFAEAVEILRVTALPR